jgi:hypothetical protein
MAWTLHFTKSRVYDKGLQDSGFFGEVVSEIKVGQLRRVKWEENENQGVLLLSLPLHWQLPPLRDSLEAL